MPLLLNDKNGFNTAINNKELNVVHFGADWTEQCAQVDDVLDTLSKHPIYSNINFYKCDAEELSEISLEHKIEAVPTVVLFRSGKAIDRIDGADPAKITDKIKTHANATNPVDNLEDRLKSLINQAKVMLFMKGDRITPRCGFSRQIIQILNDLGTSYETFDILLDEDVRQGLKTYSDWPTYPQLYIGGELVGGLDIVKEMDASGDLAVALLQ